MGDERDEGNERDEGDEGDERDERDERDEGNEGNEGDEGLMASREGILILEFGSQYTQLIARRCRLREQGRMLGWAAKGCGE